MMTITIMRIEVSSAFHCNLKNLEIFILFLRLSKLGGEAWKRKTACYINKGNNEARKPLKSASSLRVKICTSSVIFSTRI